MDNTIAQAAGRDGLSSSSRFACLSQGMEVKTNVSLKQTIASLVESPEKRSRFIEAARKLCKGSTKKFDRMASDDVYCRNLAGALIKQSHFHGKRVWSRILTTISSGALDEQKWRRCLDKLVKEYVASCSRETVHECASFSSCNSSSSAAPSGHTITNQIGSRDHIGGDAGALSSELLILNNVDSSDKSILINSDQPDGGAVTEMITDEAPVSSRTSDSPTEFFENSPARQTSSPPLLSGRQGFRPHELDAIMLGPPSPEEELPLLTPPRRRARAGVSRVPVQADTETPPVLTPAPRSPSKDSERTTSSPPNLTPYHHEVTDKLDRTVFRPLPPEEELRILTTLQKRLRKEDLKNITKVSSDSLAFSCAEKRPGCLEKEISDARRKGHVWSAGHSGKVRRKQTGQKPSGRDGDGGSVRGQNYSQHEKRLRKSQGLQPPDTLKSRRASTSQKIRKHLSKLSKRTFSKTGKLPEEHEIGIRDHFLIFQFQAKSQLNVTDELRSTTEKRMNDYGASRHFTEGEDGVRGADDMEVTDKQSSKGDGNNPNGKKIAYVLPLSKEVILEASCMQKRQNSPSIHESNPCLDNEPTLSEMPSQRTEESEGEGSEAPSCPPIGTARHNAESTPVKSPPRPMESLWSSLDEDEFEDLSAPASSTSDRTLPYACGRPVELFRPLDFRQRTRCKKQLTRDWVARLPDSRSQSPPATASKGMVGTPRSVGVERMDGCDFRFLSDRNQTWYVMSDVEAAYGPEVGLLQSFGRVQARTCSYSEATILNSSLSAVLFKECKGGESRLMNKDSVDFVKKFKRAFALLKPLKGTWPPQFSFPESVEQFLEIVSSLREDLRGPVTSIHLPQDVVVGLRQLLVAAPSPGGSQHGDPS